MSSPTTLKELCIPVLAHRIVLADGAGSGELERLAAERVVREIWSRQVAVPE